VLHNLSATVRGDTFDRNQLIESHIRTQSGLCLYIFFLNKLLVLRFAVCVFVMAFLKLHKMLAYLEATPESSVVEGKEVLCAKLLILL
jgi:hypothetical protein